MVGAGTQLTAQAGMRVLWQGGNAVDAAVAGALAAGVLEPTAHYSLGGEVAFLFYDAAAKKVRSVTGQGWAPQQATTDLYLEKWGEIPSGVLSTTVPGVISALLAMLSEYGTMSFTQAAQAAVSFAHDGFPAYQLLCRAIAGGERMANIQKYPDTAKIYLPRGKPPILGSIFEQHDLGNTLSLMVRGEQQALVDGKSREDGIQAARDVFYKGDPARRMVKALQDLGGLYTDADFGDYQSPWEEPISTTYRGYEIFTNRTWTQGITLLQTLNILEGYDLAALGHNSPQSIHLQVEALKLAFADRERYVGDPDFVDVPVEELLSKDYATLRPHQDAGRHHRLPAQCFEPFDGSGGRRFRWHHLSGHGRCNGQHGFGHAQQLRRPDQGHDPGRHRHPYQHPGLLFLAGSGKPQRHRAPQASSHHSVHLYHHQRWPAIHDPGHAGWRQPGSVRPASIQQHRRL